MSKLIRCLLFLAALALVPLASAATPIHPPNAAHAAGSDAIPRADAAAATIPAANTRRAQLSLEWVLTNDGPNAVHDLELYVPIPGDRDNQRITGLEFSAPYTGLRDQYGQPMARFVVDEVAAGGRVTVSWTGEVEIEARDYQVDPARVGGLDQVPEDIARTYTRDEAQYRLDSGVIQRAARQAAGGATNPYWMARSIHDFVAERLTYDLDGTWDDAEKVYLRETGSCSEYTFLFIALARANGLPARYVAGTVLPRQAPYVDTVFHRWAEVYLPGYGWVPVDVVHDDRPTGLSHDYFGAITDERFVTTVSGGDSEFLEWAYHSTFRYRYRGQRPEISVERSFQWTPGRPELRATGESVKQRVLAGGGEVEVGRLTLVGINGAGDWSAQSRAAWLHVDQNRGTTPAAVRVLADPGGLTPGRHTADLVLYSRDSGARLNVPVSIYVVPTLQAATRPAVPGPR